VAVATLERLEPELSDERIVFALSGFDELRTNEPGRSMVLDMTVVFNNGLAGKRSGIALPRPLRAASSNGGKGSDPAGTADYYLE